MGHDPLTNRVEMRIRRALGGILLRLARLFQSLRLHSVLFHKGVYGSANECNSLYSHIPWEKET